MTWKWSHTQEAYDNVYYNISQLPLETLKEITADIKTYQRMLADRPERTIEGLSDRIILWNRNLYFSFLDSEEFESLTKEQLTDFIYQFAEELRECTDGGHRAYISPYGDHTVSFSRED